MNYAVKIGRLIRFLMILGVWVVGTALDAQTSPGTVLWNFDCGFPIVTSPTVARDGTVYVGTGAGLFAVTNAATTVSNKWYFSASISSSSPSIGADGAIYLASTDGNLYAINSDGSKRWSYITQCGDGSPAVANDGTIYVEGYSFLYALTSSGTLKWKALF